MKRAHGLTAAYRNLSQAFDKLRDAMIRAFPAGSIVQIKRKRKSGDISFLAKVHSHALDNIQKRIDHRIACNVYSLRGNILPQEIQARALGRREMQARQRAG